MSKPKAAQTHDGSIPEAKPTQASLLAEAHALGDSSPEVKPHPADLIADAEEMLLVRGDAEDLAKRGYPVTEGMFFRVELLMAMVVALAAQRHRATVESEAKTAEGERARVRLLEIRGTLSRIGEAVGLDPKLFSLSTTVESKRLSVVLMGMTNVLRAVDANIGMMPDAKRVQALVAEADALIAAHKVSSVSSKVERTADGKTLKQLCRLLLDVLQHLSKQGLAAYEEEGVRQIAYRLDHVYGRRTKKASPTVDEPVVEPPS